MGVPLHHDRALFEALILEGVQAGLSWITVLRKRAHYRTVFDGFQAEKIARYSEAKKAALLADAGIIRNRLKVEATIGNARAYLNLREQGQSLNEFVWAVVEGQPRVNHFESQSQVPASTAQSEQLSKALKKAGFRFVGPTIVYAFMQAAGLVNDHLITCPRHQQVQQR